MTIPFLKRVITAVTCAIWVAVTLVVVVVVWVYPQTILWQAEANTDFAPEYSETQFKSIMPGMKMDLVVKALGEPLAIEKADSIYWHQAGYPQGREAEAYQFGLGQRLLWGFAGIKDFTMCGRIESVPAVIDRTILVYRYTGRRLAGDHFLIRDVLIEEDATVYATMSRPVMD